jgi:hypothetical protein
MSHIDTLAEILAARQTMIAAADQSYRYGGEAYDKARNRLFSLLDDALTEQTPSAQTDADPRYRVILAALTEQTPAPQPPPQWWSTRWGRRA